MPTMVQSCRLDKRYGRLLLRQAKRSNLEPATLGSLYLAEKALEEEYPGIGFRAGAAGREAYVQGHRVAVWEVVEVQQETQSVTRTARHFRWPPALVRSALAFAEANQESVIAQRSAELST